MEYHVYKEIWKSVNVEELNARMEPRKVTDKYAVCVSKNDAIIVDHLNKGTTGRSAQMIFYFLKANHGNICIDEVTGKPVNLGDGKEMQTFNFS